MPPLPARPPRRPPATSIPSKRVSASETRQATVQQIPPQGKRTGPITGQPLGRMDVRMREVRAEEGFLPGFALMHLIAFRHAGTADADIPRFPDVEEWRDEQRCIGIGTLPSLVRKHLPCLGGHHKDQPRTGNTRRARPKLLAVEPDLPRLGFAEPDEESRPFREHMRRLEAGRSIVSGSRIRIRASSPDLLAGTPA
jgi:hypothetical protein